MDRFRLNRFSATLVGVVVATFVSQFLPRPAALVLWLVMVAGILVWWLVPRNGWRSFTAPGDWTFAAEDPTFSPPPVGALDRKGGDVRNVLRGTFDGWPLVAWEQKFGPQYEWRCALDTGVDLPRWFARPLPERNNALARFPDEYHFSPGMHPELKTVMARGSRELAWSTSGRYVVAEVGSMSGRRLQAWLADQGRLLAELAAVLRTELSPTQLRLASSDQPPALTKGGPARNVWTPEDVVPDPAPRETQAVERWGQPDFDTRSREQDPGRGDR